MEESGMEESSMEEIGMEESVIEESEAKNAQITEDITEKRDADGKKRGITGSTLKWIAVVTMFIDHFAAAVLGRYIACSRGMMDLMPEASREAAEAAWESANHGLLIPYSIMRLIGRLAFPIYCFLLVEGLYKTKDVKKYSVRLLVFALLSEIPFDLAFMGKLFYFGYQNVFFTLFLGLVTIAVIDYIRKKIENKFPALMLSFVVAVAGILSAVLLKTDYDGIGVAIIIIMYAFYERRVGRIVAGCLAFIWELTAPLAFIFIGFYNGERGRQVKYFFYAFYPLHLLLLYLISVILGLGAYSPM